MAESPDIPLENFQQWMLQSLLDPYSGQQPINAIVNASGRLSAREHLAIYQRSYIARLRDCMARQFSTLAYALGEELFQGFADQYLMAHPPSSYTLVHLGKNFEAYLEASRPDKDQAIKEDWPDFMIELARFEYAISIIFDEKAEDHYALATESTPDEALKLIPVFHLFAFQFPIRWYYSSFAQGEEPQLPHPHASYSVILRHNHNFRLALFDVHPEQYHFLQQLKAGKTVAEAKAQLIHHFDFDPQQLDAVWLIWKKKWIELGYFRV